MYNYDTIPVKLYFSIVESGNLSLMGNGTDVERLNAFDKITSHRDKFFQSQKKGKTKELDVYCQMESLSAKYKAIQHSVYYLRHLKDEDLIQMLKSKGYKFTDDFQGSLNEIEKMSEGLLVKIESIKKRLPEKAESEENEPALDEVVLSYCALLEMGFVDTNSVTLSQYDSIVKLGNKKMDSLNKISNGRK